jgi:hypothetical protein
MEIYFVKIVGKRVLPFIVRRKLMKTFKSSKQVNKSMIECPLCKAGNKQTYVESYNDLTEHFTTHEIHNLAYAYSDLLEILEMRNR